VSARRVSILSEHGSKHNFDTRLAAEQSRASDGIDVELTWFMATRPNDDRFNQHFSLLSFYYGRPPAARSSNKVETIVLYQLLFVYFCSKQFIFLSFEVSTQIVTGYDFLSLTLQCKPTRPTQPNSA